MSKKVQMALQKFLEGYNCAQSVFYAFSEDLQISNDMAFRLACGFGAGMARKQEVCGAVSGGIIVIGARYGRGEKEDRMVTEQTYIKIRDLMDRFESRHGTFTCSRLLNNCDLTTEQGRAFFKNNNLLDQICKPCVQSVTEILESILFNTNAVMK